MAKLRVDKKREVLEFLEKEAKDSSMEELLSLNEEKVIKELKDEEFSEEDIKEMIKELKENERIEKRKVSGRIIYPTKLKGEVEEKIKGLDLSSYKKPLKIIFFGSIILAIAFYFTSFESPEMKENAIMIVLLGGIFSYVIGNMAIEILESIKKILKIRSLKPLLITLIITGVIISPFIYYDSLNLVKEYLVPIFVVIGVITTFVYKIYPKKENN